MLNSFLSLHSYWLLNIAMALSFLSARSILKIAFVSSRLSQQQQLIFARSIFVLTILAMFALPIVIRCVLPIHANHFQLQPLLNHAAARFFEKNKLVAVQVNLVEPKLFLPSISYIIVAIILTGATISFWIYIKGVLSLKKLTQSAFCQRVHNHIHLLYAQTATVPFCWSLWRKHYVVLPIAFIERNADLRLAIRHELQHIRQNDTHWSHLLLIVKCVCFWNPFIRFWINWLSELQEYACDEALILRKHAAPMAYAECLVNSAVHALDSQALPTAALAMLGFSNNKQSSILHRRISMLFQYKKSHKKSMILMLAYLLCSLFISSAAYAFGSGTNTNPVGHQQLVALIANSVTNNDLQVTAAPEVVAEINNIRGSEQARTYMQTALKNMQQYHTYIHAELKKSNIPQDFLALPLVESGYRPLDQKVNPVQAAGIWQFIPATAHRFGLVINDTRDDRLNTHMATRAAIAYLNALYAQFKDWKLAAIAYEYGEDQTAQLIQAIGSRDPWVLARSPAAPKELKSYLSLLDAAIIIMHNPTLVSA